MIDRNTETLRMVYFMRRVFEYNSILYRELYHMYDGIYERQEPMHTHRLLLFTWLP